MLVDYAQNKNQETVDTLLDPFEGHSLFSDMYAAFIAFV
jgi:Na+-transporting NADH:ubiquinone oxidoreductase subunit NqrC